MTLSRRTMAIIVGGLLGLVALNPIVYDSSTVAAQVVETPLVPGADPSREPPVPAAAETGADIISTETVVGVPVTPTVEPTASPSPTTVPTLIIGARPLSIEQAASVASAAAGQEFIYSLHISSSSASARAIRVQARIDAQIEMIGLIVSDGSCRGSNPLICDVHARQDQPATIVIGLRVRPEAQAGTRIVGQSLAQDDEYNTAATDQVFVDIVTATPTLVPPLPNVNAQAPVPTAGSAPSNVPASDPVVSAQQPSSTVGEEEEVDEEIEQEDEEQAATLTPTSAMTATVEAASPTPAATPAPTAPPTDTAPAVPVATARPSQPRPTAVRPPTPAATRPSASLPNTATTTPTVGGAVALLGLALVVRGTRRVRRAGARLAEQGAITTQLGPLLRAVATRQRAAATNIAEMELRSRQLSDRLEQKTSEHLVQLDEHKPTVLPRRARRYEDHEEG